MPVKLGSRAMDLLIHLVSRAGEVISHRELTAKAWAGAQVEESNLRFQIGQLRKALAEHSDGGEYVTSIPGRGYCFTAPVPNTPAAREMMPRRGRQLPALTEMIGRDTTLERISNELAASRLVTIVGPGGVGKTTMATAVAHAAVRDCTDAYFVDLAAVSDPQFVPSAVAAALRMSDESPDPVPALVSLLSERAVLLVLDNCEHVIEAATLLVERILAQTSGIRILATSREPLRALGEMVSRLYPLSAPTGQDDLGDPMSFPAVQLFLRRARLHLGEFDVGPDEVTTIATIARRLDGIPLAIELAVGQLNALGLAGLAELLAGETLLEGRGRRSATSRQQTMQATLAWSYDLLSTDEARALRALSIFSGGFTIDASLSVLQGIVPRRSELIGIVGSLVEKSLVVADVRDARRLYRLLETTRIFAREKRREHDEKVFAGTRHAA